MLHIVSLSSRRLGCSEAVAVCLTVLIRLLIPVLVTVFHLAFSPASSLPVPFNQWIILPIWSLVGTAASVKLD